MNIWKPLIIQIVSESNQISISFEVVFPLNLVSNSRSYFHCGPVSCVVITAEALIYLDNICMS